MEGLSSEDVAQILVVGFVLGTFPVLGCPTIFCLVAALRLRLNVAALQLVNQLSSPLQVVLLLPLAHAGSRIFGSPVSASAPLVSRAGAGMLHAVEGWGCICLPLGFVLYSAVICALRRWRDDDTVECSAP